MASLRGRRWRLPLCRVCLACMLCAVGLPGAAAQGGCLFSQGAGFTVNVSACCQRLEQEAEEMCLEYAEYGFNDITCIQWKVIVQQQCVPNCGNCTDIGRALGQQCRFNLQILGDGQQILDNCAASEANFVNYRCPSACAMAHQGFDTFMYGSCRSPEGEACMRHCGNFQNCGCRQQIGTTNGDICLGNTILTEPWQMPCDYTPLDCRANNPLGKTCAKYRWCMTDFCLIKDITCLKPTQCMAGGGCEPSTGQCYPAQEPVGFPCDDGLYYTLDDGCAGGICMGRTDYCLKYNVTCTPFDPCISGGSCNPNTGRCIYQELLEDTPCDDSRDYTLEDRCQSGLCLGRAVDLCQSWGVNCTAPTPCHDAGVCDPVTGTCSPAQTSRLPRACNDGDPTTRNDSCIDGLCLGEIVDSAGQPVFDKFLTLGRGECTDREGLSMNSYAGDVVDVAACEAQCLKDHQCSAYGYMFPLCRIYGAVRVRVPYDTSRQWVFRTGTTPLAVAVERASLTSPGQRGTFCRKRGQVADVQEDYANEEVDIEEYFGWKQLAIFFVLLTFCYLCSPCVYRSCGRCCSVCSRGKGETGEGESPRNQDQPGKIANGTVTGVPVGTKEPLPPALAINNEQPPLPPSGAEETRVAPDGCSYTRAEFLAFYGEGDGIPLWNNAKQDRPQPIGDYDRIDLNHDGVITKAEYYRADSGAMPKARFDEIDTDHDGKITQEEWATSAKSLEDREKMESTGGSQKGTPKAKAKAKNQATGSAEGTVASGAGGVLNYITGM